MKKTISLVFSLIILIGIVFYVLVYPKLEIVSGFNAKILCSCHFNTGLEQERIEAEDMGYNSLLSLASNRIFEKEKRVESSVLGMHKKIAVYRQGFGCTIVNELNPNEVQSQKLDLEQISYSKEIWPESMVEPSQEIQEVLATAFDSTAQKRLLTRAVVIIKDGNIIGEAYGPDIDKNTKLLGWSMTKSITGILAGILVKDGTLNINKTINMENWLDDDRRDITWEHGLTMTTGLEWDEDYSYASTATLMLYSSDDMGKAAAAHGYVEPPGEYWEYSSGTTNILSREMSNFFQNQHAYHNFPYERLFGPVGAKSFILETDASGHFVGSSYGYATARDWAKLGLLMLNEGNWFGNQIIDTTWVNFCRKQVTPKRGNYTESSLVGEYGGHFLLNKGGRYEHYSPNAYWMSGFQGQQVAIHPDENIVIVRLGITNTRGDFDFDRFTKRVIEALE